MLYPMRWICVPPIRALVSSARQFLDEKEFKFGTPFTGSASTAFAVLYERLIKSAAKKSY